MLVQPFSHLYHSPGDWGPDEELPFGSEPSWQCRQARDGQIIPYRELVPTINPVALQQIGSRYIAGLCKLAPRGECVTTKHHIISLWV